MAGEEAKEVVVVEEGEDREGAVEEQPRQRLTVPGAS